MVNPEAPVNTRGSTVCGEPTADGSSCQRTVLDGGQCFMHDEDGPPADHGAPSEALKGNDNAQGHRAPHVALNAFKHGVDAETSTLVMAMGMIHAQHRNGDRLLITPVESDLGETWKVVINMDDLDETRRPGYRHVPVEELAAINL